MLLTSPQWFNTSKLIQVSFHDPIHKFLLLPSFHLAYRYQKKNIISAMFSQLNGQTEATQEYSGVEYWKHIVQSQINAVTMEWNMENTWINEILLYLNISNQSMEWAKLRENPSRFNIAEMSEESAGGSSEIPELDDFWVFILVGQLLWQNSDTSTV